MGGELEAKLFIGPNKHKTIEEWIEFFSKDFLYIDKYKYLFIKFTLRFFLHSFENIHNFIK